MFTSKKITLQSNDFFQVKKLYAAAFPKKERGPLQELLKDQSGCAEVIAFYAEEVFCGFICLLSIHDIAHILYFAVDESKRGKGIGSKILQQLKLLKPFHRIAADLELNFEGANNPLQREKRRLFYLKNDFKPSSIFYTWHEDNYEILVCNGVLTEQEFWTSWEELAKKNTVFLKF